MSLLALPQATAPLLRLSCSLLQPHYHSISPAAARGLCSACCQQPQRALRPASPVNWLSSGKSVRFTLRPKRLSVRAMSTAAVDHNPLLTVRPALCLSNSLRTSCYRVQAVYSGGVCFHFVQGFPDCSILPNPMRGWLIFAYRIDNRRQVSAPFRLLCSC